MATTFTTPADSRIVCEICGALTHSVQHHIAQDHASAGWSVARYESEFPGKPLFSEAALKKIEEAKAKKGFEEAIVEQSSLEKANEGLPEGIAKKAFHELFGINKRTKGALNARGEPVPITVVTKSENPELVPEKDDSYIFSVDTLKNALLALELNIPAYVWGHAGVGKSSFWEQICNRTGRPMIRVQHTVNTEESHIVGQWTARDGSTHFEKGPLAMAMEKGWLYLADEYDFALPSVLSVYQPVLEGKPLVIKEADAANRIIKPHPNFRIVATGNTNGSGDDTGLYQGTSIQNEANYDRFGVTIQMEYMSEKEETEMIAKQAGIMEEDAARLVKFGRQIRDAYDGGKISKPISPRALINAALLGQRKSSWSAGINLAFANKLNRVDREVVDSTAKRSFGA